MKKILLILLVFTLGCKKDKDDPIPESKSARLEIEYKTVGDGLSLYYAFNNATTIFVQHIDTSYYKYDAIVQGGQAYKVSLGPKSGGGSCGCNSSILVKFNGDTLKYVTGTTIGFASDLPFIK
jgi:hypothetical protein